MAIEMTPVLQALDWCGSALGLIGAYTLAFRFRGSRYGWLAFFAANVIYIFMASSLGVHGLLAQQIGFVGSSAIGIYRHFVSGAGLALESAGERALRISAQLSQLSVEIDVGLPAEVARLVQLARLLHADADLAVPEHELRSVHLAASTKG